MGIATEIKKGGEQWSRRVVLGRGQQKRRLTAFLGWRGRNQALPRGAAPVMAFGGPVIDGQYWTIDQITEFLAGIEGDATRICVFEYTREIPCKLSYPRWKFGTDTVRVSME